MEAPRDKADMFFGAALLDETFSPGEACGGSGASWAWARHGFAAVLQPVHLMSYSVHMIGRTAQH